MAVERVYGPYPNIRSGRLVSWRIIVRRSVRAADGRTRTVQRALCYAATEEAQARAAADAARKEITRRGVVTIEERIEQYLEWKRLEGHKPVGVRKTGRKLRSFLEPVLYLPLEKLTAQRAQQLYERAIAGRAAATHHMLHAGARALCAWAVCERILRANPFDRVRKRGKPNRGKPTLTDDEARTLLAYCAGVWSSTESLGEFRRALVVSCQVLHGLRNCELTRLLGRSVDRGGTVLRVHGKGDRWRLVTISPSLRDPLALLAEQVGPTERLFPFQPDWPRRMVAHYCRLAGVPVVTAHSMRSLVNAISQRDGAVVIETVSATLGQTPAVNRRAYSEPGLEERGTIARAWRVLEGGSGGTEAGRAVPPALAPLLASKKAG